jgi:hypothetical protein
VSGGPEGNMINGPIAHHKRQAGREQEDRQVAEPHILILKSRVANVLVGKKKMRCALFQRPARQVIIVDIIQPLWLALGRPCICSLASCVSSALVRFTDRTERKAAQ